MENREVDGRAAPEGTAPVGPALTIFLSGVIAVALVGFFVGLGHPTPTGATHPAGPAGSDVRHSPAGSTEAASWVSPSVSYRELRERPIGPNREFTSGAVVLASAGPELYAPVEVTPEMKRRSLAERAALRAYNGAPPTVPHAVDPVSSESCLACHGSGAIIGGRVARPVPHERYANCQQCHAAALDLFAEESPFAESSFTGLPAPFEGERAWAGAPPVIPHSVQLRGECNACHGILGREGLRTSHPWRQSCTQCHALSQERDPVAGAAVGGFRSTTGSGDAIRE